MIFRCSKCGKTFENELKFCPYCGAKLSYGKKEEDKDLGFEEPALEAIEYKETVIKPSNSTAIAGIVLCSIYLAILALFTILEVTSLSKGTNYSLLFIFLLIIAFGALMGPAIPTCTRGARQSNYNNIGLGAIVLLICVGVFTIAFFVYGFTTF